MRAATLVLLTATLASALSPPSATPHPALLATGRLVTAGDATAADAASNNHHHGTRPPWDAHLPVRTNRPLVGVLSQPGDPAPKGHSYIAASYVKLIEAAGARAVPFFHDMPDEEVRVLCRGEREETCAAPCAVVAEHFCLAIGGRGGVVVTWGRTDRRRARVGTFLRPCLFQPPANPPSSHTPTLHRSCAAST